MRETTSIRALLESVVELSAATLSGVPVDAMDNNLEDKEYLLSQCSTTKGKLCSLLSTIQMETRKDNKHLDEPVLLIKTELVLSLTRRKQKEKYEVYQNESDKDFLSSSRLSDIFYLQFFLP